MSMIEDRKQGDMVSADDALQIILDSVAPMPKEKVALGASLGRVLAQDVRAECNLPPFDNAAMDGYAVRCMDLAGACSDSPVELIVVGDQPAGADRGLHLKASTAVRIMTGAPVPRGADAVVMVEDTETLPDGYVAIFKEAVLGENIRQAGEDIARGDLVVPMGSRIGAAEMGVMAALGCVEVEVLGRPRVAILTTGTELVDASATLEKGQIRDVNSYTLMAQVSELNCEVSMMRRVADETDDLVAAINEASEVSDVIITSGGVSVGDYDLVKETLASMGEIVFWGVAIKPGKPLAYGKIGRLPVFGLPGNPVSSMVSFDMFVRPALLRMSGVEDARYKTVGATLASPIKHTRGRKELVRAVTSWQYDGYHAMPNGNQGSARFNSVLGANSYIVVQEDRGNIGAGERVVVLLWD